MKLNEQQSVLIEKTSADYASTFHPRGSLQESVAREAHDYGMRRVMMTPEKYGLMRIPPSAPLVSPSGLNVYQIHFAGERYWVSAKTIVEAIQTMIYTIGVSFSDFEKDDDIHVVPPERWPDMKIIYHDVPSEKDPERPEETTLADYMATATEPDLIASTDY